MAIKINNLEELPINRLVAYYLMSSYIHYHKKVDVLDYDTFGYICNKLYNNFDTVKRIHKKSLDKDLLMNCNYTTKVTSGMVVTAALSWYDGTNMSKV